MDQYTIAGEQMHASPAVSLTGIGLYHQSTGLFDPVCQTVTIKQKVIKYTPSDKLKMVYTNILDGGERTYEINTRVRPDPVLQKGFGLPGCAEQSVIQQTLDACTEENVDQMYQALDVIIRRHSLAYRHNYEQAWQILDVDMTGLPCGPKAALATKGYFGEQRSRQGRQLVRVTAALTQEILRDQLYQGNTNLTQAFEPVVEKVEGTLELDEAKRKRTILRVDSAGGSVKKINWALARGYQVHCKDYSGLRVQVLAQSVTRWVDDPLVKGRQVGWVETPATEYIRPVRRIAARCRKNNGQWGMGVIISTLTAEDVLGLVTMPDAVRSSADAALLAYVYFYDQRGGTVEIAIKEDKQGLGLSKRNKKRFAAQEMLVLLVSLAHNAVIWTRRWLAAQVEKLRQYGVKRMVRDLFQISGWVVWDVQGRITHLYLNKLAPRAREMAVALTQLLASEQVQVDLGET